MCYRGIPRTWRDCQSLSTTWRLNKIERKIFRLKSICQVPQYRIKRGGVTMVRTNLYIRKCYLYLMKKAHSKNKLKKVTSKSFITGTEIQEES